MKNILVTSGAGFIGYGLAKLLQVSWGLIRGALIFAYPVHDPDRYGVGDFDTQNRAISLEEKLKKLAKNMQFPVSISTMGAWYNLPPHLSHQRGVSLRSPTWTASICGNGWITSYSIWTRNSLAGRRYSCILTTSRKFCSNFWRSPRIDDLFAERNCISPGFYQP